jgi:uncharacterized protein
MLKCKVCGFENKVQNTCTKCGSTNQIYIKALPLSDIDDVSTIRKELNAGNILIVNIIPFLARNCASKDFSKLGDIIRELSEHALSIGGDVARIGEERLIFAPSPIRIWDSSLRDRMDHSA